MSETSWVGDAYLAPDGQPLLTYREFLAFPHALTRADPLVRARFFTEDTPAWSWYPYAATLLSEENADDVLAAFSPQGLAFDARRVVDVQFIGLVCGPARELGPFTLRELAERVSRVAVVTGASHQGVSFGAPWGVVHRDRAWVSRPLSVVNAEAPASPP